MAHIPEHNCPTTGIPAACYTKYCETKPCEASRRWELIWTKKFNLYYQLSKIAAKAGFTTEQAKEILNEGESYEQN
jgi:hypothetical protein